MSYELKMYQELYNDESKKALEMSKIIGYAKGVISSAAIGLLNEDQLMEKYNNIEKMWNEIYPKEK
jgi:hypothetical protein